MGRFASGRRGFLGGVITALLSVLAVRRTAADEGPGPGGAPSGAAATWKYRWREALKSPNPGPRPKELPADFVPVGDHQKSKTHHWVRAKDWPLGPTIQSQDGEIISVEFRIAKIDFCRGFSWALAYPQELRERRIDHIDVEPTSVGHPGFEAPHYEIHAYFVPHSAHGSCDL